MTLFQFLLFFTFRAGYSAIPVVIKVVVVNFDITSLFLADYSLQIIHCYSKIVLIYNYNLCATLDHAAFLCLNMYMYCGHCQTPCHHFCCHHVVSRPNNRAHSCIVDAPISSNGAGVRSSTQVLDY